MQKKLMRICSFLEHMALTDLDGFSAAVCRARCEAGKAVDLDVSYWMRKKYLTSRAKTKDSIL